MRLGKTALIHFGSNVVVSATGFVATFAIAYLLGPAGLGEYAIATALGFFWLAIPAGAIGAAIRKRVSEGSDRAAFATTGLLLNGLVGLLLAVTVFLVGAALPTIVDPSGNEFVRVLSTYNIPIAVLVLGSYGYRSMTAVLQGHKRVGTSGIMNAGERILRTLAQVAALVAGFGVTALVVGHAATLVLTAVVGLSILGIRVSVPDRRHVESLMAYARYAWMGALQSRTFGWMDTIVLSFFVSATFVGIYEAAWGVASLLAAISSSIQRTLFPEMSDLSTDADFDRVKHYLDEGLVFSGVFVIPGFFGAALLGDRILAFYSPEFTRGATVLVVLVLAYGFDVYASQILNVINAIDHPDVAYRVNGSFIVSNLVLNVVLVGAIGWVGAALATAASSMLRLGLGYRGLSTLIGQPRIPTRELVLQIASATVMVGVVAAIRPLAFSGRVGTIQLVAVGATLYVLLLIALSGRVRGKVRTLLSGIPS